MDSKIIREIFDSSFGYRIKDGYYNINGIKIQSGIFNTVANADVTITFHYPYINPPIVLTTRRSGASTTTDLPVWLRGEQTSTSFKVYSTKLTGCMWIAIGY